jgi:putative tributyrin esterase
MPIKPVPFFSSVLYARKTCFVYVPPGYETSGRSYPVVYLLHGMYQGETDWSERGGAQWILDRMIADGELEACIAVMPSDGGYGNGTFYMDWYDGTGNFEQYFIHDVVGYIESHYRTIRSKEARALCGLSMGGFGAALLALRHPELFGSAASLSGALGSAAALPYKDFSRSEFPRMIGPAGGEYAKERDIYRLAAKRIKEDRTPALYMDCGSEDSLLELTRAFDRYLTSIEYPHECRSFSGGHNFDYWSLHLEDALRFIGRGFRALADHGSAT